MGIIRIFFEIWDITLRILLNPVLAYAYLKKCVLRYGISYIRILRNLVLGYEISFKIWDITFRDIAKFSFGLWVS